MIEFQGTDHMYEEEFHVFLVIVRKPGISGLPERIESSTLIVRVSRSFPFNIRISIQNSLYSG